MKKCIGVCKLDRKIEPPRCVGCDRTIDEITDAGRRAAEMREQHAAVIKRKSDLSTSK